MQPPVAAGIAVAYLTNAYPRPSHSFIRREIMALERQGFRIHRISIRPLEGPLPDGADQYEAAQTQILLGSRIALMASFAALALTRPKSMLAALATTLSLCGSPARLVRHLAYLVEACWLVRYMERNGIRHVHVHFGTNPANVALLAHRLSKVTYSITIHGPDEFDAPVALALARKAASAAFVVAISNYGRGQLMRWLAPVDWPRIAVVRCGVDAQFQSAAADVFPTAAPAPVSGLASRRLVCIARLNAQKGLPLLIEAAGLLAKTHDFELRVIGGGEMHDALVTQIGAAGLENNVHLLGPQPSDIVRTELLAARALVSSSFAEGLPVVMMEAFGLGRPVIATSIAGVPELVDASCGWLVPSGCAEALATAMATALDTDPTQLATMGEAGRRRVRASHDADTNADQLASLLRPLATG